MIEQLKFVARASEDCSMSRWENAKSRSFQKCVCCNDFWKIPAII